MKTLVTGAGGFIGSHLVEALHAAGHEVRAFVRYNSRNSWGWLEECECRNEVEVVTGDVTDSDATRQAVDGCAAVFHLAALIGIPYSYVSPQAYVRTNVVGTQNILDAARAAGCESVIVTSTSETYGSAQYVPIDEAHPLAGQSPYAASKIGADQLALSYHRSFGLPVRVVRPFNTFGPRQSSRAIIPTVIEQLAGGGNRVSVGNTSPTRDLTIVDDTVAGFIAIAEAAVFDGDVVNIASGAETSIGDLITMIGEVMGVEVEVSTDSERVRPAKSEVTRLLGDNTKLVSNTDWRPGFSLEEGLRRTIDWQTARGPGRRAQAYSI